MTDQLAYCCTEAECNRAVLVPGDEGLSCANGHVLPFTPGTRSRSSAERRTTPTSACDSQCSGGARQRAALGLCHLWRGRGRSPRRLAARLQLREARRCSSPEPGPAMIFPSWPGIWGAGEIYAQDIAAQMLLCRGGTSSRRAGPHRRSACTFRSAMRRVCPLATASSTRRTTSGSTCSRTSAEASRR